MTCIVECASQAEEDLAFTNGAKIVIRTDLFPQPTAPVTYEDLTTYIEIDPTDVLAVTANDVTFTNLTRLTSTYVYKDFGVDYFADFSINFEYKVTANSSGAINFNGMFIALSNSIGEREAIRTASGNIQGILCGNNGASRFIGLCETKNGSNYASSFFTPSLNVNYYCTLSRVGTALNLKLYSDEARTTLVSQLSITVLALPFQYLYPVQSVNSGTNVTMSGVIGKISL
ncbi:MAG: hypothetical protein WC733_03830 [Methylophilus sp.]|jgi:hypothetical protein